MGKKVGHGPRIHRLSCLHCGRDAAPGFDVALALEVANLRALGAAIGDHRMYGELRTGPSLAATVFALLGEHARMQAILEAVL